MLEFPIEKIYRRIAQFDVMDNDKGEKVSSGCGFFYLYDDKAFLGTRAFFVTRSHVAMEEKGFLPDSIVVHVPADSGMDTTDVPLQLYDKEEKPVWRVLLQESDMLIVIPISGMLIDNTRCFYSEYYLPSHVHLQMDLDVLNIPVQVCLSLAEYIFYSNKQNEQALQTMIEAGDGFRVNRKGLVKDMTEMVLVLLQQNLDKLVDIQKGKKQSDEKESETFLALHDKLLSELENIIAQFGDVLEPSIFERIQDIFAVLKERDLEDYLAARYLIRKVLMLLGQNIVVAQ